MNKRIIIGLVAVVVIAVALILTSKPAQEQPETTTETGTLELEDSSLDFQLTAHKEECAQGDSWTAGNLSMVIQGKTDYKGKEMCHAVFKEGEESVDYYFTETETYLVIKGEEIRG